MDPYKVGYYIIGGVNFLGILWHACVKLDQNIVGWNDGLFINAGGLREKNTKTYNLAFW